MNKIASAVVLLTCISLFAGGCGVREEDSYLGEREEENKIIGNVESSGAALPGKVDIEGVGSFFFDPGDIVSIRVDLFQAGHFSIFDVLVHLHDNGKISMDYEFREDMNTHVPLSINGISHWWYSAYYDGGWRERSVFRMDHYPYKDKMFLQFVQSSPQYLKQVYGTYLEEVSRRESHKGAIVIPQVVIRGKNTNLVFTDVEVKAHNLRKDVFQEGVTTAIDVILTLGEVGLISYDLQWYDSIGTAEIVRSYWVNRIDEDKSAGRCGFVYEAGSEEFRFFAGNHNHIPSDTRIINSPEYLEYFWICI